MATLKLIIRSTKEGEQSNIYVYYSVSRKIRLYRKTGYTIDLNEWDKKKEQCKLKTDTAKNLNINLKKLKTFIEEQYNNAVSKGTEITGEWLQQQIDLFNNKVPAVDLDILTNYTQKFIDEAPFKKNQKNGTGLSSGRVQNIKLFQNTIEKYQKETLNGKSILIKNINLQFVEAYKLWLFNKGYSINYVGKNIANIKTICNDAYKNDIKVNSQLKNIKGISESKEPENIVFLTEEEQEQIKDAVILREALQNARRWLLLGCLVGQRAGDLLTITDKNIKDVNGIKIIELKQKKTGKIVAVPLLPEALEIIESGLPYKISVQRFNEYIKDICEIAGINQLIKGRKATTTKTGKKVLSKRTGKLIDEKIKTNKEGIYPKFELISSHCCRRSFASNFYGRIPTPVLMNITGHGTERMFLIYCGSTTYDNAYQMLEYFSKLAPRTRTTKMDVIHNTGTK